MSKYYHKIVSVLLSHFIMSKLTSIPIGENTITDICHVGAGNQILIGESDGSVKLHERKEKIVNFSNPEVSTRTFIPILSLVLLFDL